MTKLLVIRSPAYATIVAPVIPSQKLFTHFCIAGGINLALGQPAYQSSTYNPSNTADKAVDGNTNGFFSQLSCACVLDGDSNSWFVVDLGTPVFVQYVVLKNRKDCCGEYLMHIYPNN